MNRAWELLEKLAFAKPGRTKQTSPPEQNPNEVHGIIKRLGVRSSSVLSTLK